MRADRERRLKVASALVAPFWLGAMLWLGLLCVNEARIPPKRAAAPSASAFVWDARGRSWTRAPSLAAGRTYPAASVLPDGAVLIAGGWPLGQEHGPTARERQQRERAL
jgi:hypothetical protein